MNRDMEYFRTREQQERLSADRADDDIARRVHLDMAERYAALLREMPAAPAVRDIPPVAIQASQISA